MAKKTRNIILAIIIIGVALFVIIQLVPYGKDHANPLVVSEPNWDSQQTHDLARRACFDCHSNETIWPWYSNIAPVSWLVYHDVEEGRNRFNLSDWQNSSPPDAGEFSEVISESEMPPFQYLLMHSSAKLSAVEKEQLITGLQKSLGK